MEADARHHGARRVRHRHRAGVGTGDRRSAVDHDQVRAAVGQDGVIAALELVDPDAADEVRELRRRWSSR